MNNRRTISVTLIAALLVGFLWSSHARGMVASFLIEGADQTRYESLTPSVTLNGLLDSLGFHFVVDMADSLRHAPLIYPAGLSVYLDTLPAHFVIDMADANRFHGLAYPHTLIGDTTPPQEEGTPEIVPTGPGSVKIRWRTDEFSRGTIAYGSQPGQYVHSTTEPLYAKDHELTLTGLPAEGRVYYRITNIDPAGNQAHGVERNFTVGPATMPLFLPMVVDR